MDNKELIKFMYELIWILGINTAHDYDGIESKQDISLYQKCIKNRIEDLIKQKPSSGRIQP